MSFRGFGIKVVQGLTAVLEVVNKPSSRKSKKTGIKSIKSQSELPGAEPSNTEKLIDQAKKIASQDGWMYVNTLHISYYCMH